MELFAFIFIWPILVFTVALLYIMLIDLHLGFAGFFFSLVIFLLIMSRISPKNNKRNFSYTEQIESLRLTLISLSIASLLPIFINYLVIFFNKELWIIIFGLFVGFGFTLWGMFLKDNKVLIYSNILGGALILVYVYSQLWGLGEFPRIIAAALGLLIAISVSIIKLKDKLT